MCTFCARILWLVMKRLFYYPVFNLLCSFAYWLEIINGEKHLVYLSLNNAAVSQQENSCLSNITVSAITLDPLTGDLWVSDYSEGGILSCICKSDECREVVDASRSGMYAMQYMYLLCCA